MLYQRSANRGGLLLNANDSDGISEVVRTVDAFGKLGAGYLQGNLYALGDYDECFSLTNTQYCLSDVVITFDGEDLEIIYAICLPQTCGNDDIIQAVNSTNEQLFLFHVAIKISSISCEDKTKAPYNAGAIIMILIWCLIGAMVIGATVVHATLSTIKRHKKGKKDLEIAAEIPSIDAPNDTEGGTVSKFAFALSLYKTVPAMLSTDWPQQKSSVVTSLHGLKVISLLWIILGNTHLWSMFFDSNSSLVMNNVVTRFSYQAILSSPFGFDSFFLLSGTLIAYVALQKMANKKTKRHYAILTTQYIRRILHFTPVYAIILFSYWLLTVHFGDGPFWRNTIGVGSTLYKNCEKNWWTNLFYINNLYPWANLDECMPWSWYVSNEIQFFVFAPVMIVPLYLFYPIGLAVVGVFLVASVIVLGGITGVYKLSASVFLDLDTSLDSNAIVPYERNAIDDIQIKPWTHVSPFAIGILVGFLIFKKVRLTSFRAPITHVIYACLWVLAIGLCFSTVYGLHGAYDGEDSLTGGEEIVYQMFSRVSWALGLAIVIFSCHNGYGWIVNDFLSMKIWTPLSRLSLITYLVHPIVLFVIFYTRRGPVYSTDITLAMYAIAAAVLSYGAAAIIASFVHLPLLHVETAALMMVGLSGGGRQDTKSNALDDEQEMEAGLTHENYYVEGAEELCKMVEGEVAKGEETKNMLSEI